MPSPLSSQRVYIVGAGVIAAHHLRATQAMPHYSWEWHACDIRPEAAERLKTDFPALRTHPGIASMLAEEAQPTDIVIICTPPSSHAAMARQALSSGRHVLCEKPLFLSSAEADSLESLLEKTEGLLLGCCSNRFLGRASLLRTRELIEAGRIGRLYRIRWCSRTNRGRSGIEYQPKSRWFLDRRQSGGGTAMDWGPYDFAALHAILQPKSLTVLSCMMEQVKSDVALEPGTVFDVEAQVVALLRYELADGGTIHVDYERTAATHGREETIFEAEGTEGAIDLDWIWSSGIELRSDQKGQLVSDRIPLPEENGDVHGHPIQEMVKAVRGEASFAVVNETAFFNFRCLRALYECHEGGRPVQVKRDSRGGKGLS